MCPLLNEKDNLQYKNNDDWVAKCSQRKYQAGCKAALDKWLETELS